MPEMCFWIPEYSCDRRRLPREPGASLYPELHYQARHARVLLALAGVWTPDAGRLERTSLEVAAASLARWLACIEANSTVIEPICACCAGKASLVQLRAALRIRRFCVQELLRPGKALLALMRAACRQRAELRWGWRPEHHACTARSWC